MKNPSSIPRQGFTLIEMLVIIAIIALLVLLMLPGINKSMEAARTVKCAGGMQQVAGAVIQFAADHDGVLPKFQRRAGDAGYDTNWGAELILGGYVDAPLADSKDDIPAISPFRCASGLTDTFWSGELPADLYTSNPNVHRPWAAYVTVNDASGTSTKYVHIWYAINARTENPGHPYPFDRPKPIDDVGDAPRRLARLRYLDKTVMFYDGVWCHNFYRPGSFRFYPRHGIPRDSINMVFFDGRVGLVKSREFDVPNEHPDTMPRFTR